LNGDTSAFERLMKLVKIEDEKVVRSRSHDGGNVVFEHCVITQFDRGIQRNDTSTSAAGDASMTKTMIGALFEVGSGREWTEVMSTLRKGNDGPQLDTDCDFVLNITSFIQDYFRIDALVKSRREGKVQFSKFIHIHEYDVMTQARTGRHLVTGNCIQLEDDRFAQVIVTNVQRMYGSSSTRVENLLVNIFDLMRPNENDGKHPDVPVIWLKRQSQLSVISVSQVRRRALVLPLFQGGEDDAPCELFPSSFVVDESVFPYYVGPPNRQVFLRCPHQCGERIPKPATYGSMCVCSRCGANVRWL